MKNTLLLFLLFNFSIKILAQVPTITDFNPKSGDAGSMVIITGTNFSTTPASNIVFFGATKATVTAATATQLTVTVPAGAIVSSISVAVNGLTGFSSVAFIPAFRLNKGNLTPDINAFISQNIAVSGISPALIAVADIDGDGKSDAVFTPGSSTVHVIRNTTVGQTITFAPLISLPATSSLFFLRVADLDGDNKPEIISCTANAVFIWKNKSTVGTIAFDPVVTIALDSRIFSTVGLEVADFDKDGKSDVFVAGSLISPPDSQRGIFSLLRNTSSGGNISFTINTNNTGNSRIPRNIVSVDVNQDNKPDLVVYYQLFAFLGSSPTPNGYDLSIEEFLFTPTTFSLKNTFLRESQNSIADLEVGDLNGDTKPDILTYQTQVQNQQIVATTSIFQNTSTNTSISFIPVTDVRVNFPEPRYANSSSQISTVDYDGDGRLDIMATVSGNGFFWSLYNRSNLSDFSFLPQRSNSFPASLGNSIAGDLNNDGKPEVLLGNILTGNFGPSGLLVAINNTPTQPIIYNLSPEKGSVQSIVNLVGANFGNSIADNTVNIGNINVPVINFSPNQLTVTVPAGASYYPITVNNGTLQGQSYQPFWVTFPSDGNLTSSSFSAAIEIVNDVLGEGPVAWADMDNDGKMDLVTGINFPVYPDFSLVSVYKNTSINGKVSVVSPAQAQSGKGIRTLVTADLNNDNKLDVITLNQTSNNLTLIQNTTTASGISFADKIDIPFTGNYESLAIGDIDGDGKPDLALISTADDGIILYRNTSTPTALSFVKWGTVISPGLPHSSLALYDLDNDNKPELISIVGQTSQILVFKNTSFSGNFGFETAKTYSSGLPNSPKINVADLNADNKPDLVGVDALGGIRIFPNNGSNGVVSFASPVSFNIPNPRAEFKNISTIFISDMDGDGKPDLIFDDGITIYLNQSIDKGAIVFGSIINFTPNGRLEYLADVDTDGKPDFITRNPIQIRPPAPAGYLSGAVAFLKNLIFPPLPSLQTVSPVTGAGPGRTITLTGTNLTEILSISFAGVNQPVFSASTDFTQITAIVPDGATSGNIVVTTRGGTAVFPFTAIDPANFITGSSTICPAQQNLVYSVPAVTGASGYEWTVPAGMTITKGNTTNTITVKAENTFTGTGSIRVRGTFGTFKGENSPTFNVSVATIPNAPANLQAKIAASGTVALTWEDKSTDETQFFIYRAVGIDTAFVLLGKAANNLINFTDNFDLKPGISYFYRVASANGECLSVFLSNTVGVTLPPATITALAGFSEKSITISPNPSTGLYAITAEKALTGKIQILVSDALGKTVWQENWNGFSDKKLLDLSHLPANMYFLTFRTHDQIFTRKLLKQ